MCRVYVLTLDYTGLRACRTGKPTSHLHVFRPLTTRTAWRRAEGSRGALVPAKLERLASRQCDSVARMPLPVSKSELNRLGDRLVASQIPCEDDLSQLAIVLAAYQDMLDQAKVQIRDLGFAPTARVKTTTTMTDKLRR